MATIGGLTNSTANSIRGYGGLASGLDRDTLIEGMTYGTTSKITQQQQKKQQLEWKQNAVRAISDMMIAFANKYTATLTSSSNLFSSMLWGRNNITTTGTNSKFVSVTGTASAANAITIMGVRQMAQDAKWSSSEAVSDMKLQTGKVGTTIDESAMVKDADGNPTGEYVFQNLVDKTLNFAYGGSNYSITLGVSKNENEIYNYKDAAGIEEAIKDQLDKIEVGDNKKLSDIVEFKANNGKIDIIRKEDNPLKVSGSALDYLGFSSKDSDGKDNELEFKDGNTLNGGELEHDDIKLTDTITFAQKVAEKELTFSYNGTSKTIKMPTADELKKGVDEGKDVNEVIRESIEKQLDSAFGKGRIKVELGTAGDDKGKLSFTTYKAGTNEEDKTSTLTLVSGSSDLVGPNGVLGIKAGTTNRVNMNESLVKAGIGLNGTEFDADGNRDIMINDTKITINKDETVNSLMKKINESGAGVKISYQTVGDKFTFTSTEKGASGSVKITGTAHDSDTDGSQFLNKLFGVESGDAVTTGVQGKDAVVAIKYNGSDDVVELIRDSNSFTVDGLSIGVKGTFGYKLNDGKVVTDKDGKPVFDSDPVEIDARVNTDNIVDSIKSMVEEYNKIIDLVNKELTTKPDRDYAPLTSEQKKELSESEIETWEEKAKSGMLYGDSDLRSLSSDLRFIISGGNMEELRKIGITTSTLYSDNGKLTLDESKLRAALETDPESVEKLFTSKAGTDADGNKTFDGIATNLKNVMDKYVKTLGSMESKGILIKKAGSTSSPVSLTENAFYKQLAEINKQISKLQTRLESEKDRYIKQFTSLETLISQMNSQSSWLSQIGGY